jgi:hypothetical protein
MAHTITRIDFLAAANGEFPFQPEAVLPVQFHHARRTTTSVEGINCLMCAILVDAVRCFQTNLEARHLARQQQFREAHLWIFSDEGDGPFSFKEVCSALELDPRGVRRWLLRWQERRRAGERPPTIRRSSVGISRFFTVKARRVAE